MKAQLKNNIYVIFILIFTSCKSNLIIKDLNGSQFSDNFNFFSMNVLGITYSYKFENDFYSIIAKSNQGTTKTFEEFEVENGKYSLKKNEITLYPKTKLCINIGAIDGIELILPYKFSLSEEGVFYVSCDTLLGTDINNLRFIQRSIFIQKIEGKIGFIDNEFGMYPYFELKMK